VNRRGQSRLTSIGLNATASRVLADASWRGFGGWMSLTTNDRAGSFQRDGHGRSGAGGELLDRAAGRHRHGLPRDAAGTLREGSPPALRNQFRAPCRKKPAALVRTPLLGSVPAVSHFCQLAAWEIGARPEWGIGSTGQGMHHAGTNRNSTFRPRAAAALPMLATVSDGFRGSRMRSSEALLVFIREASCVLVTHSCSNICRS